MGQAGKLFDIPPRPVLHTDPAHAPDRAQDIGPRKLVRPYLSPASMPVPAPRRLRGAAPLVAHEGVQPVTRPTKAATSHAETFYFQKQMQAQTQMVFVMQDGEEIQGVVEWFDRDSIKVRNHTRVLLFKRGIKYIYKANEQA